jgi:hypothetical protein
MLTKKLVSSTKDMARLYAYDELAKEAKFDCTPNL